MRNPLRVLRAVETTGIERAIDAPPVLIASANAIEFFCGNCAAALLRAEEDQVHGLVVHCTKCGSYNATAD